MPAITAVRVASSSRPSADSRPSVWSVFTTKPSSARIVFQAIVRTRYEVKNGRMISSNIRFLRFDLNAM